MINPIIIASDAMGGDNSPNKVIDGISLHSEESKDVNYKIFGNKELIEPIIKKNNLSKNRYSLIHTVKPFKEKIQLYPAKEVRHKHGWPLNL